MSLSIWQQMSHGVQCWLEEEQSQESGWSKDDGSGETRWPRKVQFPPKVLSLLDRLPTSHLSVRKSIEILKKNPSKDPDKCDQKDVTNMRKAVTVFTVKGNCIKASKQLTLAVIKSDIWLKKKRSSKTCKSYRFLKNRGYDVKKTWDRMIRTICEHRKGFIVRLSTWESLGIKILDRTTTDFVIQPSLLLFISASVLCEFKSNKVKSSATYNYLLRFGFLTLKSAYWLAMRHVDFSSSSTLSLRGKL